MIGDGAAATIENTVFHVPLFETAILIGGGTVLFDGGGIEGQGCVSGSPAVLLAGAIPGEPVEPDVTFRNFSFKNASLYGSNGRGLITFIDSTLVGCSTSTIELYGGWDLSVIGTTLSAPSGVLIDALDHPDDGNLSGPPSIRVVNSSFEDAGTCIGIDFGTLHVRGSTFSCTYGIYVVGASSVDLGSDSDAGLNIFALTSNIMGIASACRFCLYLRLVWLPSRRLHRTR